MPLTLKSLTSGRSELTVTLPVGALKISYNPHAINANMEQAEQKLHDSGMHINALASSLAEAVVEWDVVDDKGKPVAPAKDVFLSLGYGTMRQINSAIWKDLFPNPTPAAS